MVWDIGGARIASSECVPEGVTVAEHDQDLIM